jgi:hypothetical protein
MPLGSIMRYLGSNGKCASTFYSLGSKFISERVVRLLLAVFVLVKAQLFCSVSSSSFPSSAGIDGSTTDH